MNRSLKHSAKRASLILKAAEDRRGTLSPPQIMELRETLGVLLRAALRKEADYAGLNSGPLDSADA